MGETRASGEVANEIREHVKASDLSKLENDDELYITGGGGRVAKEGKRGYLGLSCRAE